VALMRVYCGLATTESPPGSRSETGWLTAAVVDDAGRLLDLCDIADDASGYAELGGLLADRSGGTVGVAVAADSDDHEVTLLLTAAGRPLAIADDEMVGDYAERFADDESVDEISAGAAERNAVGLARALQAGAMAAAGRGVPRDLMALGPVLTAHAAVAISRHGSAVALREVLRELYPAALRAYPDPAEPIPLAILDALPEPGLLGANDRSRDSAVAGDLVAAGVADSATIADAITALRVAAAETPRRTGLGKGPTSAVAETIRQSVAAVRACDAAISALIGLIASNRSAPRAGQPARLRAVGAPALTASPSEAPRYAQEPASAGQTARHAARRSDAVRTGSGRPNESRSEESSRLDAARASRRNRTVSAPSIPSARPAPESSAWPGRPAVVSADAADRYTPSDPAGRPARTAPPRSARRTERDDDFATLAPGPVPLAPEAAGEGDLPSAGYAGGRRRYDPDIESVRPVVAYQPADRPESGTVPDADPLAHRYDIGYGSASSSGGRRRADPDEGPMAISGAGPTGEATEDSARGRHGRAASGAEAPLGHGWSLLPRPSGSDGYGTDGQLPDRDESNRYDSTRYRSNEHAANGYDSTADRPNGYGVAPALPGTAQASPPPPARPTPGVAAPGSRTRWPLNPPDPSDDMAYSNGSAPSGVMTGDPVSVDTYARDSGIPRQRGGRVRPPWQADDLALPPAPSDDRFEPPALRLVSGDDEPAPWTARHAGQPARTFPPAVASEADDDLLIFAQARSAWFVDPQESTDPSPSWSDTADQGWSAAERASHPTTGGSTDVGLPRRVPNANLVPGSPLPTAADDGPRIIRDPAAMAAHTTGYFRGSRRGEEVRGYAVGGRPGRDSGDGWDFSRDGWETDDSDYRSAARR
jgi:hypothetical protein